MAKSSLHSVPLKLHLAQLLFTSLLSPKISQKKGGVAHIHATRGHCHPFKLTLSHPLAVLSSACSVATLSLPSIFACQVSTDYSMPTLQSASSREVSSPHEGQDLGTVVALLHPSPGGDRMI